MKVHLGVHRWNYAPGHPQDGSIQSILAGWKKEGIGVPAAKKGKKRG